MFQGEGKLNFQRAGPGTDTGARVVLLDDLFVAGRSSPISEQDADNNTYQARKPEDGSVHRMLKNFPALAELTGLVSEIGRAATVRRFGYCRVLEYRAPGEPPAVTPT